MTKLNKALNLPATTSNDVEIFVPQKGQDTGLTAEQIKDLDTTQRDFELVRENLMALAEKGANALEEAIDFASQSQAPRAFEVVSNLISSLTNTNKEILTLSKTLKEIKKAAKEVQDERPQITNNTLIMSTADLLKKLTEEDEDGEE